MIDDKPLGRRQQRALAQALKAKERRRLDHEAGRVAADHIVALGAHEGGLVLRKKLEVGWWADWMLGFHERLIELAEIGLQHERQTDTPITTV